MSHRARLLIPAAVAAALAVGAPVASAAPVTTANACRGEDGQYGDLPLQLATTASQNGRQLDVAAIQPSVAVPSWVNAKLQPYISTLAIATGGAAGTRSVKVDAWMAVAAAGSTDAPRMVTTTGSVNITIGGDIIKGYSIKSITLTLQPSVPTSWHAPDAGGTVSVAQAPAGSLPAIPGGAGGATVSPTGSLYIRGSYSGLFNLLIDCQPGSTGGDGSTFSPTFTPGAATPIVSSVFGALPSLPVPIVTDPVVPTPVVPTPVVPTPATPTPAAPTSKPASTPLAAGALAISATSLKFGSAAVLVNVSCPAGGDDCTGSAVMTSAKKLRVGKGAAKLRKLASGTYSVKAGVTAPVKLKLSSDGKKLRKTALVATVTLKPTAGAAVVKSLRANG